MSSDGKIWIGADPGGKGNFGLAILRSNGSSRHIAWIAPTKHSDRRPASELRIPLGLVWMRPLWWSSGRSGDRQADQWLRTRYGLPGGQVQAANSLRGAALVQGAMFVQRMREHFPGIGVTETHPKAVWKALKMESGSAFVNALLEWKPRLETIRNMNATRLFRL